MSGLRFKIGDAFPADDPVARFVTGLAMICNDWLRFMGDFASLAEAAEGEDDDEAGARHVAVFRVQAALLHEAAAFVAQARRKFPEIARFIDGLDDQARSDYGRLVGVLDTASDVLGPWLKHHRDVTFHYPELDPNKARNGNEEMTYALTKAARIDGEIKEVDGAFGTVRFYFADQVGAQLLPDVRDGQVLTAFGGTGESLARFAQLAINAYLATRYREAFEVID
jgi:hypothetical protein